MIERLYGTVCAANEKQITVMVNGIGFGVQVPSPDVFPLDTVVTVYTYVHPVQDRGITLYGFPDTFSRQLFLLIINCPKVGPSIALGMLRQSTPTDIVRIITAQDDSALSQFSGIGAKTAEQMIINLKGPVGKMVSQGAFVGMQDASGMADWQHVSDALATLNYSSQEISRAIAHVREVHGSGTQPELNVLLRTALAFLAG